MIQIYRMPVTGAYETVKSTLSSMDDPYENVLEYRSYWLTIYVVLTLKKIFGWIFFLFPVVVKNV